MTIRIFAIFFSTLIFATFAHAQEGTLERSDWKKFFDDYQAKGTIVVADERQALAYRDWETDRKSVV